MSILRHILYFVLEFVAVTGACIAWTLWRHGMAYSDSADFHADLRLFVRIGLVAAGLFTLIVLCYLSTQKALGGPPDPPDTSFL